MFLNNEIYQEMKVELEGLSFSGIWWSCVPEIRPQDNYPFQKRKIFFFELIQRLMEDGKIRLANHGIFLEGTIEEQIARFKDAFPKTEEEWKARDEEIWFLDDDCPGGAVWVLDDGYLDWT
ncbi:DUF596 domain-containing protein [Brenneria rubrifaciens]|nr:DUF596 domain-containing protein [Brenneria rubrifaciens]